MDYKTAMLFPTAFFLTRIIVSLPTSFVMQKIGYKKTLKYCLYLCCVGCLTMSYFVQTQILVLTLLGIFIMASGISAIQVVSSPYVSLLSSAKNSMRRQSIATASNSIGTVIGPIVMAGVIIAATRMGVINTSQQISILFLIIAAVFLIQIAVVNSIDLPDIQSRVKTNFIQGYLALFKNSRFMKLLSALMLYIGMEVSFGTFTIAYLADEKVGGLGLTVATQLIAIYWAFMFLGRFTFARYSNRFNSVKLFTLMCVYSVVLSLLATQFTHVIVGLIMLLTGLFNATLYPIVYAQALKVSGKYSAQAAALMIMSSIGGAILPLIQASVIDSYSMSTSYWVPVVCYSMMIWLYRSSVRKESKSLSFPCRD